MMEQKIVRSYQDPITCEDTVNELLSKGWVVVCSNVVPADSHLYGYIEYVLERQSIPRGVEND